MCREATHWLTIVFANLCMQMCSDMKYTAFIALMAFTVFLGSCQEDEILPINESQETSEPDKQVILPDTNSETGGDDENTGGGVNPPPEYFLITKSLVASQTIYDKLMLFSKPISYYRE